MVLVYLSQTTTTDNYYSRSRAFILLNNFVLNFRYPPTGSCLPNDKNIGSERYNHSPKTTSYSPAPEQYAYKHYRNTLCLVRTLCIFVAAL